MSRAGLLALAVLVALPVALPASASAATSTDVRRSRVLAALSPISASGDERTAAPLLAATSPPVVPGDERAAAPPPAAASPFGAPDDDGLKAAERSPSTARLDRVAAAFRTSPLVVDPELDWILDGPKRRALERRLRAARIPVFVAVLPSLDEDESGGDPERMLQTLQRRLGRDGLYVVVDAEGRMDLASLGVPLDLAIPFSLLSPSFRDDRPIAGQERDPAPPGWTTVPERLGGILDAVAKAGPGTPNGVVDDVDDLEPLAGTNTSAREREDVIAATISGTVLGLIAAGTFLGGAAAVRATRAAGTGGGRPTPPSGTIRSERLGRGGADRGNRRRSRSGRRRG